jgi:hypothetical protein
MRTLAIMGLDAWYSPRSIEEMLLFYILLLHLLLRYFEQCHLMRMPDLALAAWHSPVLQQSKEK